MSSPKEESFEDFLERSNRELEAIRNPAPLITQQTEPHRIAPYQTDPALGFSNLPEMHGGSLAPDDGLKGPPGDQYPNAEQFVNPPIERQRSTPSQRSQKRGFPKLQGEHCNRFAPNAAFNGTSNFRSLVGVDIGAEAITSRTIRRSPESRIPTFHPPKLSKRSERLANVERQIGPGGLGANGLAKGLVRSPTPGVTEWWSQDRNAWIPAIYHENLRPSLLAEARQLGKYEHPRAKGNHQFDETSFLLDQEYWAPDRENGWYQIKDYVLFRFQRGNYPVPQGEVELWYYQGRIVLDMDNHPVKKYSNIPACCSSDMEGWLMEAISRLDGRITQADFRARMPSTRTTNTGEVKPLFALTALGMRMNRFRDEYSCPAWNLRTGGEKIKEWFWNRMSQEDREMGMTCSLGKLTELELVELRALNKGTHPERAGRNALTSEERTKRKAEAEKKLQLKYGEQAMEVLAGTKRKRYEVPAPEFGDEQPVRAAKQVKMPNDFPSNEQLHHYNWDPKGELYGQPYDPLQDTGYRKRKHADADENPDDEEPAQSRKRQESHGYLPHQHFSNGYPVNNGITIPHGPQNSSSRRGTSNLLSRNLNPSSQSSLQRSLHYGQPGTNKGKRAAGPLPPTYGSTPMDGNRQYPTYDPSQDPYTTEADHTHIKIRSQCEQHHPAQGNLGQSQYKRSGDSSGSQYELEPNTERPCLDTQGSYTKYHGFDDDLNVPLPGYDESYPPPKQEAPTSKRKRDEVVEESDSEEDQSFLSKPKRQKPTPSDALSGSSAHAQPLQRKPSIGLKIHSRVAGAGNALNTVKSSSHRASGADPQPMRKVWEGTIRKSLVVVSDEVEAINERPVSIQKPKADQSVMATLRDYAIENAEPLPFGAVDFRYIEPILAEEQKSIALAIGYTRSEYVFLIGEAPPQTSPGDSYATQYAEIQAALAARWVAPEPVPQLICLGAWSTEFADFPMPDLKISNDQQEELARICNQSVLGLSDPAHQTIEENPHVNNDQPLVIDHKEVDSLLEGDTLVANPEDELDLEKSQDEESDPSPSDSLKKENLPISDDSQLPVVSDEDDELNSLFDEDTRVADPEHRLKPEKGQGEESPINPQADNEGQDDLDSLFEDDTLVADPEDESSPEEGQDGKSDTNRQTAATGPVDVSISLSPDLDDPTTQLTYEEVMGVDFPSLTEEEMSVLNLL